VATSDVTPPPATAGDVARDSLWLPHRYDPEHDAIHFLHVDRATHGASTFLTDTYLPGDAAKLIVRREECAAAARAGAAPLHFILHSGYCCSTLLARALDLPGRSMGLKEPQILNDIVGWRRRGGDPKRIAQVLDDALDLLAQPFSPGESVIVKPSNVVNAIAAPILVRRPTAKALLLYAPLPVFLASIAGKGMWGAIWVREHFIGAMKDGVVDLGFTQEQLFGQTDLQIAALGWLAQQTLFAKLIAHLGSGRIRSLDSELFLARKREAIYAVADVFELPIDAEGVQHILHGPAFTRHSKVGMTFDTDDRARMQGAARETHREEIEKVTIWAQRVADDAGIAMTLGAPLLG